MADVGLLTVGHGRLAQPQLGDLLRGAAVERLVDVRRFPGSRANPATRHEALARWLPECGVAYRWDERLGGRRTLSGATSEDPWWQVEAFRAYAAHTRTEAFRGAMSELVHESSDAGLAVMCSETLWWRCHRRIIADVAVVAHGLAVHHLMHDGRLTRHEPSAGVRLRDDGRLVWDRG